MDRRTDNVRSSIYKDNKSPSILSQGIEKRLFLSVDINSARVGRGVKINQADNETTYDVYAHALEQRHPDVYLGVRGDKMSDLFRSNGGYSHFCLVEVNELDKGN